MCALVGVALSGCGRDSERLVFRASSQLEDIAPSHLSTTVWITNTSRDTVPVDLGCSLSLHVVGYRTRERSGRPAWDSRRRDGVGGRGWACIGGGGGHFLPGETKQFGLAVPLPELFGDTLAEGRYYLTARFELFGRPTSVDAGNLVLTNAATPIPAERTYGGVTFRAATGQLPSTPGKPPQLRLAVTITNRNDQPVKLEDALNPFCGAGLSAFSTAVRRDTWYLQQSSDAFLDVCPLPIPPVTLAPGEARVVERTVEAGALAALNEAHLLASLRIRIYPPGDQSPIWQRVTLPAGSYAPAR